MAYEVYWSDHFLVPVSAVPQSIDATGLDP